MPNSWREGGKYLCETGFKKKKEIEMSTELALYTQKKNSQDALFHANKTTQDTQSSA